MGNYFSKKGGGGGREKEKETVTKLRRRIENPYVFTRTSSMFFDEDGDLAHEFYTEQRVEVKAGVVRWVMRKVSSAHLTPQGTVDLPFPRLHVDLPVVIVDAVFTFPVRLPD